MAQVALVVLFQQLQRRRLSQNHNRSKKKSNGAGILVGYGIADGYDNDMDDDDQKGSRGIPSRTGIGKKGAIIEKFPSLGNPLVLFGGIITIPFWGYLTTPLALMEVMMADLPHVQYNYKEKWSKQQEEDYLLVSRNMQREIKEKGLIGSQKLNLNFSKVVDGNQLLAELDKNNH